MQSYLYINKERVRGIYTQVTNGIIAKKTVEKSESAEGSIGGGVLSVLTTAIKGTKGAKDTLELLTEPENMVAALVNIVPEVAVTKPLVQASDWSIIGQGDLVVF